MVTANADAASDFLFTNDAARFLDVSPQMIRVRGRAGRLPALKPERRKRPVFSPAFSTRVFGAAAREEGRGE
jgi:hypothetical protein